MNFMSLCHFYGTDLNEFFKWRHTSLRFTLQMISSLATERIETHAIFPKSTPLWAMFSSEKICPASQPIYRPYYINVIIFPFCLSERIHLNFFRCKPYLAIAKV